MKLIRVRQNIEINEGCILVNPVRKGLEIEAGLTCEQEDELTRFDAAADKVKQNVADQLAAERAKLEPNEEEE